MMRSQPDVIPIEMNGGAKMVREGSGPKTVFCKRSLVRKKHCSWLLLIL